MIAGNINKVIAQIIGNPKFETVFKFLLQKGWEGLPEGRFEIEGTDLWGMVQIYETESTLADEFETHRLHIDFHYMVEGEETIYWIPSEFLKPNGKYDEIRDVWIANLAVAADQVTALGLRSGEMAVFFPSDGHWPRRARNKPTQVKKILVKIPLDL